MPIVLSIDQLTDLLRLLGAAEPLFRDIASKPDTPGVYRQLLNEYADTSVALRAEIVRQANSRS